MIFNQAELTAIIISLLLLWEYHVPREVIKDIFVRWFNNIGMYLLFLIGQSLFFYFYQYADKSLLPKYTLVFDSIGILKIIILILVLDCIFYWVHRLSHYSTWLWRCHLLHHSDTHLDLSTNFRHHPFEFILAALINGVLIYYFYVPAEIAHIYFSITFLVQIWHHSNIELSDSIERVLGVVVVTPRLHRVHHSILPKCRNANYGNCFIIWDKIFSTYVRSDNVNKSSKIGLEYFRTKKHQTFFACLLQPFKYKQ